ncbi:hypothetical protein [Bordetella holmesii]|uniref:Uncharacterized protein n=2 Tax=Bordetella holmesii TaxID=35814 RepID=A0A158M886_9BORD|nr:hypothetical protein [Bordetella holmesii]AHV92685.1 hypothetical protein D560_3343 [Bordetella holmesii ATCC 51541]AIT27957.1 hypothetical protein D558_3316 [Bordetella holmesii 44057]EWM40734.1 hypothetical protein D555_3378 [Bordetella holmesii 35009]EWM44093.1 hypothetical protein D556_3311 [Bordetella holmesii 41130]EWM44630.1 hypothetical protein D557_2618 [Bordetella holmesii 70147]
MRPYHSVVLDILSRDGVRDVLDAPCGTGWLGERSSAMVLDGVGL